MARNEKRLERKNLNKLIAACNSSKVTTAVLFKCPHNFPDAVLMALDHAIAHWVKCKPYLCAVSFSELEGRWNPPSTAGVRLGYWEGKEARVRKVRVEDQTGKLVRAVEVTLPNYPRFFIADEDGSGWFKVTSGERRIEYSVVSARRVVPVSIAGNGNGEKLVAQS